VLAQALDIPATDNRQQEDEDIRAYYRALGQPMVPYGDHVEKLDAIAAIAKYRPQVVIACWVTHRFEADCLEAGGSATGVDEAAVVAACEEYIVIGNERVHAGKPIWALPTRSSRRPGCTRARSTAAPISWRSGARIDPRGTSVSSRGSERLDRPRVFLRYTPLPWPLR
jgi:hypothetical protein